MHNPEDYRKRKDGIIKHFFKKEVNASSVSEYCTLVGIPLVVVYTFLAEEDEKLQEFCAENIKRLQEFYGE